MREKRENANSVPGGAQRLRQRIDLIHTLSHEIATEAQDLERQLKRDPASEGEGR